MCGRSSLTKTEKELEERFGATFYSEDLERYNPLPNFNVAPSHILPVILNSDTHHFNAVRWGFIPFWAKDIKISYKMINARIETLLEKNTFKSAVKNKRCLIPSDGFYEWKKTPEGKTPYRIARQDNQLFSYAGLWSKWQSPDGESILSFTIITQAPNKKLEDIHDRMPAMLMPEQESLWLDDTLNPEELLNMISPYPDDLLKVYPVSDRVNKVGNNDPSLIEEAEEGQGTLF